MTSQYLIPDIEMDEGCRLHAYPDPLSGGEPFTVGYGCTGPDIGPDTVWTQEQADTALQTRVAQITAQLAHALPWFTGLSDLRQDCLVNMVYNLGLSGLLAFHNALSDMQQGNFSGAAANMLNSRWASQVGGRAQRLAQQMLTDTHI